MIYSPYKFITLNCADHLSRSCTLHCWSSSSHYKSCQVDCSLREHPCQFWVIQDQVPFLQVFIKTNHYCRCYTRSWTLTRAICSLSLICQFNSLIWFFSSYQKYDFCSSTIGQLYKHKFAYFLLQMHFLFISNMLMHMQELCLFPLKNAFSYITVHNCLIVLKYTN